MYSLNKSQVDIIISDVENARITFSHLADDLIDHICCEVESMMNSGKDFNDAYEIVKQQAENKVLYKIQENTIYLIDKNYRRMKTTMKITGNVSLAILGIATVMKILHLPGAGILLMLGFVVLCLIFFPSAIYANYKEQKIKGSKVLHLSILIGGILFMFGVLFKVLHLKGAAILLSSGWILILFIFLPILLYVKMKEASTKNEKRIIVLGIIGLIIFELSTMLKVFHLQGASVLMILGSILLVTFFLPTYTYSKFKEVGQITGQYIFILISTMFFILLSILLALNVSVDFSRVFVNEESNSVRITNYLEKKNQKLYEDFNNKSDSTKIKFEPQVIAIQNEAKQACQLIDSIKLVLIMTADQVTEAKAKELTHNLNGITNKYNFEIVNNLMVGENSNGLANKIKQNINKFQKIALSATSSNSDFSINISKLLDTSDILIDQEKKTWEQFTFGDNVLISAITILTDIEKKVRMVESQTINHLISNCK